MAVVREFDIGHTHIRFCDDFVVKTKEEVDAIIRNVERIWLESELDKIERRLAKGT